MTDLAPARDAPKEKTVRLITVQRADILDHFDKLGVFRADWHAISVTGHARMAYDHVLSEMKAQGLSDGAHPPVWTWQTDRVDAIGRAFELLSDAERDAHAYVLIELAVPDRILLRSSYQGWCDLYFDCVETGRIHDDGHWRDWKSVDLATYDVVQALLPHIEDQWITGTSPLPASPPATDRFMSGFGWYFAGTTLIAIMFILFWFTTPLLFAFTQWPTNAAGFSWLKALYNATYALGIPALIIGQIAAFLLARNGFMTAAYRVPAATLVPFFLSAATLFVLT